jgi:hypothetical protein
MLCHLYSYLNHDKDSSQEARRIIVKSPSSAWICSFLSSSWSLQIHIFKCIVSTIFQTYFLGVGYYTNYSGKKFSVFPHRSCSKKNHLTESSELGPPTPSPASECCPPPFGSKEGDTLACAGEGVGVPVPTKTDTLVYYSPSTSQPHSTGPRFEPGPNYWQAGVLTA